MLFHLAHAHNHETGRCDPSQGYLAQMTNMGVRTVRRHLSSLEEKGRIYRQKRGTEASGRTSDSYSLGHQPANLAANVTGQTVQTYRPNGARKVHEMAAKQEVTGREQEEEESKPAKPPVTAWPESNPDDRQPQRPADQPPPKARLPSDWALDDAGWAYARSQQIPDEVTEDEARGFHAYWTDRRDREGSKSARGWATCWEGWCRRIAVRYRRVAGPANSGGYGQGSSIASIAARRRAAGQV